MLGAKSMSTPMDCALKLSKDLGTPFPDSSTYRRLVGKLLYLANTWPDISYAVGRLSQFLDYPTDTHLHAANRVLRYLKHAPASGLFFPTSSDLWLKGFTNSDWGACLDIRRSITSFYFFIGSSLVSWKSKK